MFVPTLRLALVLAVLPLALFAQSDDGITVIGEGTATLAADRVEIRGTYEARAEMPGDAFVKFAQASKRIGTKMGELEVQGLTMKRLGTSIGVGVAGQEGGMNNVVIMGMGGNEKTLDPEVVIKERFVVSIPLAGLSDEDRRDAIASVLEACRELKVKHPGGNQNQDMMMFAAITNREAPGGDAFEMAGAVSFHAKDPMALYREATKAAIADAKQRAEVQAGVFGSTLGGLKSIVTIEGGRVGASKTMDLTHRMKLQVRFAIK